ncbi:ubiquitin carboxyl-terminal hydrolase 24-like isoform X2 [Littorina saxatilis]
MNALKEVTKLIEESSGTKISRIAIHHDKILDWLVEHHILSVALEGNIDQAQYCDKIKGIVDFLGSRLSVDELAMIWKMQNGQTNNVIDNIHSIVAAAAVKFDAQQLEHLFLLIQKKWQDDNDRMREKLLSLIGKIGKDARVAKTTTRVLELLWDLAHLPALSRHLVEHAQEEHHAILSDSYSVKEQVKLQYVQKCVDDIKKGACVLPALRQLMNISKNIIKASFQKADKGVIHELNKNCDVMKLVTNSLVKCHKQAVTVVGDTAQLTQATLVDGRYTHCDYMMTHLNFLQYVLQEGVLYLSWNRARDIWSTMVANPRACDWDRETCYEWMQKGLMDLEMETQMQLFQKEILRLEPSRLSEKGFHCFKCFFESVNLKEHRLKRNNNSLMVEKVELLGLDYLWEVCLHIPDEAIADSAIQLLLNMSYNNLNPRLKKDPLTLHKKFISECYTRLEMAMIGVCGNVVAQTVSNATKILTAAIVPEVANVPLPSRSVKLLPIERLLWIAEAYVLGVEELHVTPRTILPHAASFHGYPLTLTVRCEALHQEFNVLCHSNETLHSLRQKIISGLHQTQECIQIHANDKLLCNSRDHKLLHQLEIHDGQVVQVRLGSSSVATSSVSAPSPSTSKPPEPAASAATSKQNFEFEQEKMLPGVVMAKGGEVFHMLYQLSELEEPKITKRVQKLLMLIPTDPAVLEALDTLAYKSLKPTSSSEDVSGGKSGSPHKSSNPSAPSATPRPTARDTMKQLFDSNAPDMSPFRILYNLEVLSSKLMPTQDDAVSGGETRTFCEEFLNNGGLSLVVNVLQPESLPSDINYEIRQGCYSICLQLARYLLCGLSVTEEAAENFTRAGAAISTPSPSKSAKVKPEKTSARQAIQTLSALEFVQTVSCFMRVTWAGAAGRLHLLSYNQPIRETRESAGCGHRSRQSSTGSTASTSSDSDCQSLHAGVCAHQTSIPTKDANIAREALEILVTCLQLRSELIASFYSLPSLNDFIIDLLVGCPLPEMRAAMCEQLWALCQLSPPPSSTLQPPRQFVLQLLHNARLPFWVTSTSARGSTQKMLGQCSQYFDLRCRLLENLSVEMQRDLQLDIDQMLEDEIGWLSNFVPSRYAELQPTDNILLAGHLHLVRTFFTCQQVSKEEHGEELVGDLLHDFLFPASKLMMDNRMQISEESGLTEFNPKCSLHESRLAAFELLTELCNNCPHNLTLVCRQLLAMHHQHNTDCGNEWEYMPPVDGRASCGYVGLKNAGATCYMNSVLQQLYMVPGVPEAILSVDEDQPDEDSVFNQVQQVFGHLMESRLQYHEPERFWSVFKLWGQTINVREQQDAFDFFQAITDQIDEHMKKIGKEEIFKSKFQGKFSDQKICKDCPHRYEREEDFIALNLTVKNATLQDSLDQFVKGELLEGDNAYFCEKCGEKRNTIKRMCIKTLPSLLCIQLKRFGYDWEANRALKFDDFFKFPWILNMEPYTAEGMARQEAEARREEGGIDTGDTMSNLSPTLNGDGGSDSGISSASSINGGVGGAGDAGLEAVTLEPSPKSINYELVGIVVHSGQANAGHYYSYIKDRRGTVLTNPNKGKWFKFNDTIVEEFHMNDTTVEQECFGGVYKAKVFDSTSSYPEDRLRYWNGYLLFYEKMEEPKTSSTAKRSRILSRRMLPQGGKRSLDSNSLMELEELVHKGEQRGIFVDKMPAPIQQAIHAQNITFVKNRDVYSTHYFTFLLALARRNADYVECPQFHAMCVNALQLSTTFLLNTYLRTRQRTQCDLDEWVQVLDMLMSRSKEGCLWFIDFLATDGNQYLKPFLLECPVKEVRVMFSRLMESMITSFLAHGGVCTHKAFDAVVESFLRMLEKDVIDFVRHCSQYFRLLRSYIQLGTKACVHMFGRQGFQRLIFFLLGNISPSVDDFDNNSRRWSSMQAREFGHLHNAVAMLVLNCDVTAYRTEDIGEFPQRLPLSVQPKIFLKMHTDMHKFVFGPESVHYLREVVQAVRELVILSSSSITDMLLYCCFCNTTFSLTLLKLLMLQYTNAPSNELKSIFTLLTDVLLLEDPLQATRLKWIIDGYSDDKNNKFEGLISVIRLNHVSDSRRSYQCIKFLVGLSNRSALAKDNLLVTPSKWQWAVNWLKKKMTEYYWSTSTTANLSNDDSNRKSFQRTQSAQHTLQEATALLTEIEGLESGGNVDVLSSSSNISIRPSVHLESPTIPTTTTTTTTTTQAPSTSTGDSKPRDSTVCVGGTEDAPSPSPSSTTSIVTASRPVTMATTTTATASTPSTSSR